MVRVGHAVAHSVFGSRLHGRLEAGDVEPHRPILLAGLTVGPRALEAATAAVASRDKRHAPGARRSSAEEVAYGVGVQGWDWRQLVRSVFWLPARLPVTKAVANEVPPHVAASVEACEPDGGR
jgi:hypothetical protein